MMKLIFINDVNPDIPHISAVRLWAFAQELAARGHQVVYVTRATRSLSDGTSATELKAKLALQDWRKPLLIELGTATPTLAPQWTKGPLVRRILTALNFLIHGGPRWQWSRAVARNAKIIAAEVRPDLIWATFGNTNNLIAAQALSRAGKCPWVMDVKDNWELFVPKGLRRITAWRTRGYSAITTNAEFTRAQALKWQRQNATVIYSGVDNAFLQSSLEKKRQADEFYINIIGSLYNSIFLREIIRGITDWIESLPENERQCVRIRYLGSETALFNNIAVDFIEPKYLEIKGYVPIQEMARLCRMSLANLYVKHEGTFHHKVVELLACGRPTIAYPCESSESHRLAASMGGRLIEGCSPTALKHILGNLHQDLRDNWIVDDMIDHSNHPYTWFNLSKKLEKVFLSMQSGVI